MTATPSVPPDTVVYAVGDVHGRDDLLAELHERIAADAAGRSASRRVLVHLGDYVDRGPASRQVVDRLTQRPLPGFEIVTLMGNHERLLIGFLEGDPADAVCWIRNGGAATLASYGVEPPTGLHGLLAAYEGFVEALPEEHRRFYETRPLTHRVGDYVFVHAGVDPRRPLDDQDERTALWVREPFLNNPEWMGAMIVHGHTPAREPVIRPNRIGVDTGAFASGVLTALVLEGTSRSFIQAKGERA